MENSDSSAPQLSQPLAAKPKQRRGFAAMSPEKQKAIAALGGKASHVAGTGHEWSSSEARAAGRRGGRAAHNKRLAK